MIVRRLKFFELIIIFMLAVLTACSSYNVKPDISAEERLSIAKKMFDNEDYFEAKRQFKILTLNNPGATFIDEAQFYLAECHYNEEEYILAADEYRRLVRLYPRSQWVDDSEFKIAMCDFKLSPKAPLDQKYTKQAVENFQRFLEDFPNSDLVPEAEKRLRICRTKLAKKEYKTAELYRKLSDCYASLVYLNGVLEQYYDTRYAQPALYWKGECLYELDRLAEAAEAFEELLRKYPASKFRADSFSRLKEIKSELAKTQETDGKAPLSSQTKDNKKIN
ncbi:outer membrane protein assembly factor BamD [candidate division KSB1 bacterium]|nr:outer membrane protein assembly factor BamD [candidate division KSB1 bacterium]NIR72254.1 outer membrane protein assembly factor BamD [candidate division KSB1 bacterium]NIS24225.1 outer membrane protein assembly factor BamD [candidate division KSB1 bacterium]NIT71139.1 outer membrane protein assembly factor BamD [candidate division KSB1 bacterium]NIU24844.1 outer membrane protein assembly factor BamD [candidate division KSB1 bacterium]